MADFLPRKVYEQGMRKLSDEDVRAVRRMAADGVSAPTIAKFYPGVGVESIRRCIRRETFGRVQDVAPRGVDPDFMAEQMELMRRARERLNLEASRTADGLLAELEADQGSVQISASETPSPSSPSQLSSPPDQGVIDPLDE